MSIWEKYRLHLLRRRTRQIIRNVRLCNPETVKSIGILWFEEDVAAFNFLTEQFKSPGIIMRDLCFVKGKESGPGRISKKDLTWAGFPGEDKAGDFIRSSFELLLNISVQRIFALDAITALSAAAFKIGWDRDGQGYYDLSVDVSGNPDAMYLAQQEIYYLQQLNNNTIP